jgi:uncharacterized protein (DUF362 family)
MSGTAYVAVVTERSPNALRRAFVESGADLSGPVVVKPNFFSSKPGGYTSVATMNLVLTAVGDGAVVIEGGSFAWTNEPEPESSDEKRPWFESVTSAFLRRTELDEVLSDHGARFVNTASALLDGALDRRTVEAAIAGRNNPIVRLKNTRRLDEVPAVLEPYIGATLVNLAKVKLDEASGSFSFATKNLFGLVPQFDLRGLHGVLGEVCADVLTVYSALFKIVHVVEAFDEAVVYRADGAHDEVWGGYDLVEGLGVALISSHPVTLDIAAARAFGLDPENRFVLSACAERFGRPEPAYSVPEPDWSSAVARRASDG